MFKQALAGVRKRDRKKHIAQSKEYDSEFLEVKIFKKLLNYKSEGGKKMEFNLTEEKRLEYTLQIWKVSIETQMHFNELLIKMRTAVISIVLASFGVFSFVLKESSQEPAGLFNIDKAQRSIIAIKVGICFLIGQFLIDFFYYFRLLTGAVNFTKKIDEDYKNLKMLGLTESICKEVPGWLATSMVVIFYAIPVGVGFWLIQKIQLAICCNVIK
jgi:hypothetical protein